MIRAALAALALACVAAGAAAQPAPPAAATAERGRVLFTDKQCARCHVPGRQTVGPSLETVKRPQGAYELVGRLWNHAPAMFMALQQQASAWPTIDASEMAALMAYLGADPARDPSPDQRRGQILLLTKGCLKCHAYRGEGATVAPDLTSMRSRLAPPPVWGAAVWRHTPAMSEMARARGVLYPRFDGADMAQLVNFLRAGQWL